MKKIIVHHRSSHHAQNSGYGQLSEYLDGEKLPYLDSKFPYKIAKFLAQRTSNTFGNYDTTSVVKDYELCKHILCSKNKGVVHYLNGERDIRWGIQLNKIRKKYKIVATFHKPPAVLKKNFNPKIFKKLDGAIAVGQNQVQFLKEWLGIDNVMYIPHGIDTSFFVPDAAVKESNTILFVGQHLRDFEAFNYAIPKLKEALPELKVHVVMRKDFAKKIIPNACITIHSGIDDLQLRELYQKASLLFLPLKDSTACNSILEAMSCGLPIVSTNVGGNSEYVKNGSGVLVEPNDYMSLIDATVSVLKDRDLQDVMSKNAQSNSQEFGWIEIANKVNDFYKKLEL